MEAKKMLYKAIHHLHALGSVNSNDARRADIFHLPLAMESYSSGQESSARGITFENEKM